MPSPCLLLLATTFRWWCSGFTFDPAGLFGYVLSTVVWLKPPAFLTSRLKPANAVAKARNHHLKVVASNNRNCSGGGARVRAYPRLISVTLPGSKQRANQILVCERRRIHHSQANQTTIRISIAITKLEARPSRSRYFSGIQRMSHGQPKILSPIRLSFEFTA